MFVVVPHNEIALPQEVFYRAAIATVRYVQAFLNVSRTERKGETILVATQIQVYTEGYTGQFDERFLPFVDRDL